MEGLGFDLEREGRRDLQRQRESKGSAPHVTRKTVMTTTTKITANSS